MFSITHTEPKQVSLQYVESVLQNCHSFHTKTVIAPWEERGLSMEKWSKFKCSTWGKKEGSRSWKTTLSLCPRDQRATGRNVANLPQGTELGCVNRRAWGCSCLGSQASGSVGRAYPGPPRPRTAALRCGARRARRSEAVLCSCSVGLNALDAVHYLSSSFSGIFLAIINVSGVSICLEFLLIRGRIASGEVTLSWHGAGASTCRWWDCWTLVLGGGEEGDGKGWEMSWEERIKACGTWPRIKP